MIIGLTGGIGSGKSIVAQILGVMGCQLYNSDERARQMYFVPEVRQQIIALLGPEAYLGEQQLNKSFIAQLLFGSAEIKKAMDGILHPAVGEDFRAFVAKQNKTAIIVKETALLFEARLEQQVDAIVLVTAPLPVRIHRVMQRDGISEEEVLRRIHNQWPDEKKTELSDHVIFNDGQKALIPQVLDMYHHFRKGHVPS